MTGLCALAILAFLKLWVLVPAPIDKQVIVNELNYPDGTLGLKWVDSFSNLEVVFINPTSRTYKDLDLTFETDLTIMAAVPRDVSGCNVAPVETGKELWRNGVPTVDSQGKVVVRPYVPSSEASMVSARQYRLQCPGFPSLSRLEIVFALANLNSATLPVLGPRKMPTKLIVVGKFTDMGRFRDATYEWHSKQQ